MRKHRTIIFLLSLLCGCISAQAEQWTTYFAYNNVTQIAMASDKVFAISDGNLFSVNKQTEQITKYDRLSGLHGTGINCIHYDSIGRQLVITYGDGKIDILTASGVRYISDLYNKEMTQRKDIYNVTIQGRTAYFSTHYGVQTMDLRDNKLVDSYWLRPGGQETPIGDVRIIGDSIYTFGQKGTNAADSLFCASLRDNLVDYTYWKREKNTGRIARDTDKGTHYQDATSNWYAGGADGIKRVTMTETITYKPDGPLVNTPYRITATKGNVWVVQGGRWAAQYNRDGIIMRYNGTQWTNISRKSIEAKLPNGQKALDFMNVAVDPQNRHHYYVTSYGTGLYEFDHDTVVRHEIAGGNNPLTAAAPSNPQRYTRLDFAIYDNDGNLWFFDSGTEPIQYQIVSIDSSGIWHGLELKENNKKICTLYTPGGLIIDSNQPNLKWICNIRGDTYVGLIDDNGTRYDDSDDRTLCRSRWINQVGQTFQPNEILAIMQDLNGRIWIGTDIGAAYIETGENYFTSDAITQPDITDINDENPLTTLAINALCQTPDGKIWVGTKTLGVYVLNSAATEIVAQYTTANSAMPSNGILSLACDENGTVWIGTDAGLVACDNSTTPTTNQSNSDNEDSLEQGSMQQWRLHLSYRDATEIAATPSYIYAIANNSLFSLDRADETLNYWSRATGLNGTTVSHIAYDNASGQLIVAYEDGRIDLINKDGDVKQMPDLYMKAGSMATTINSIMVGSNHVYLAMPFGIVAIQPRKGEIADTYYIGDDAAAVDVLRVVEKGDSLYAFTADLIYCAALKDNLVDYSYWHKSAIITDRLQNAVIHNNKLYTLQHDSLYYLEGNTWKLINQTPINWIHASGGQLLLCTEEHNLFRLSDDNQLIGLSNSYYIRDAVYSQGEYWLGEKHWGLIKLGKEGDNFYHTNGPNSNFAYSLCTAHGQVYSAIGGRWAAEFTRFAAINIFTGTDWIGRDYLHILSQGLPMEEDPVGIAVDKQDPSHFFVATYGTGIIEFRNYNAVKVYSYYNSTLQPVNNTVPKDFYTRTDGIMFDNQNNLWVMNATDIGQPIHIMTPDGIWHALSMRSNGVDIQFTTPTGIWIDKRNEQYKWMMDQRSEPRLILLNDGGTPTDNGDDKCMARNTFIDQNGNYITPASFRCFAQDHSNRIWIGTEKGIILIPSSVDFFTSNACRRIIIPRNDGTGLGDYLLGEEQINCMAVDGGNRIWIGTANSGLYLIEDDTICAAHFTETNSLLPSNSISSITIVPGTGEVFVGTDRGIASYRSDASEPQENMSNVYAYPNPVRPDYGGLISITGLMENTVVNIVDAGGNLVCKTKSHGGTAVWDGRDAYGRRATPGIYTALCNANGNHAVVKILIAM